MSKDANSFDVPSDRAAGPATGPASGAGAGAGANCARTVREQAQDIIDEVLDGTAPGRVLARDRLRRCVFRHPGHPELALLEHLMSRDESYTSLKNLA